MNAHSIHKFVAVLDEGFDDEVAPRGDDEQVRIVQRLQEIRNQKLRTEHKKSINLIPLEGSCLCTHSNEKRLGIRKHVALLEDCSLLDSIFTFLHILVLISAYLILE